ncbi:MAG: DsbA family protein, partial [Candidatus Saccharimonadales bacterium]
GKFWEMHDQLYENQQNWTGVGDPLKAFSAYAEAIGIADMAKFETDYKSKAVNDIINADLREGQKISITSTPTFVLDGIKITENPRDLDAFNKLIDDAIARKSSN